MAAYVLNMPTRIPLSFPRTAEQKEEDMVERIIREYEAEADERERERIAASVLNIPDTVSLTSPRLIPDVPNEKMDREEVQHRI